MMSALTLFFVACLGSTYSLEVTTAKSQNVPLPILRVVTVITPPFMMEKKGATGNDRFEGFLKDLLMEVASRANFDFTIKKVSLYGRRNGLDWTGALGEIVNNRSDLAVAPLTITEARKHADNLQFAEPFMKHNSTLVVSSEASDIDSLQQLPCANSSITKSGAYANVGAITDSTTYKTIRGMKSSPWQRCWQEIEGHSVPTQDEGLKKAREGSFAFVMEKPSADYIVGNSPCDLKTQLDFKIGDMEGTYAFAMRDHQYFEVMASNINQTLRNLKDEGVISELYNKWWVNECSGASHSFSISIFSLLISILISKLV